MRAGPELAASQRGQATDSDGIAPSPRRARPASRRRRQAARLTERAIQIAIGTSLRRWRLRWWRTCHRFPPDLTGPFVVGSEALSHRAERGEQRRDGDDDGDRVLPPRQIERAPDFDGLAVPVTRLLEPDPEPP
jgi:hypothetical protein